MKNLIVIVAAIAIFGWTTTNAQAQKPREGRGQKKLNQDNENQAQADQENQKSERGEKGNRGDKGQRQKGQRGKKRAGENPQGKGQGAGQQRRQPTPEMIEALFNRFDQNKDGKITKEEAPERMQQRFAQMDNDSDGNLTQEEFLKAAQQRMKKGQGQADGQRAGKVQMDGKDKAERQGQRGKLDVGKMIARSDKNDDGKLSKEEAPERRQQRFSQIDTSGDGFVDEAEMKAMFAQIAKRRGENPGGKKGGKGNKGDEKKKQGQIPKRPDGF